MHSKRKIPASWRTGWKAKACTSFALYFKVFKNHLYDLQHVRVLSLKPCLHTQLPEHNRSYWKVSWGWGHLITWNGPIMEHLNSFSASRGRNLNKNFPKIQMPGGGGCLSFDLTGTLVRKSLFERFTIWNIIGFKSLWGQKYTCQLFLKYRREIFVLGVLGFLKTTRSFLNISEEVRSLPKKSEVFRRRPSVTKAETALAFSQSQS